MAVNTPRPDPPFAGNFEKLVKGSLQLGDFVCPYVLPCKRGRKLFLCSLDDAILGGRKARNSDAAREWLFVELNAEKTTYQNFWWCDKSTIEMKIASVSESGRGNMQGS